MGIKPIMKLNLTRVFDQYSDLEITLYKNKIIKISEFDKLFEYKERILNVLQNYHRASDRSLVEEIMDFSKRFWIEDPYGDQAHYCKLVEFRDRIKEAIAIYNEETKNESL